MSDLNVTTLARLPQYRRGDNDSAMGEQFDFGANQKPALRIGL
jgi:hypothetical protein